MRAETWRRTLPTSFHGEAGVVYYFNSEVIFPDGKRVWYNTKPFTLNPKYGKTIESNLKKMDGVPVDVRQQLVNKREAYHIAPNGTKWIVWISDEAIPANLTNRQPARNIDKATGREVSSGGIIL